MILLPAVRGEPNEPHEEKYTWVASVTALSMLLLVLIMLQVLRASRHAMAATTRDQNTMTMAMTENMSGVELMWTERGEGYP